MNEMQTSRFYVRWFETGLGWTKSFRDWLAERMGAVGASRFDLLKQQMQNFKLESDRAFQTMNLKNEEGLTELRRLNMAQYSDASNAVAMLIAMMNGGSAEVVGIAKATAEAAFENAEAWQQEVERLEALRRQAKDNVKKANSLGESVNLAAQWIPLENVPSLDLAEAPVVS